MKIRKNTTDRAIHDEMFCQNTYEIEGFSGNKLVIDIGANVGFFSLLCKSKDHEVQVEMYEPIESNFKQLLENMSGNDWGNDWWSAYNFAVSDFDGEAFMVDLAGNSRFDTKGTEKVQVLNINSVLADRDIDLLKLDIEGAEYRLIWFADLTRVKRIVMEFHNTSDEDFGLMIAKLSITHQLKIVGSHEKGGTLWATRY